MKVLLAHDFYRSSSPSGEDAVYRNERRLLEAREEVIPYERHNDDIVDTSFGKRASVALDGAWSHRTFKELKELIRDTKPDIAHFHNTFPLISPSAYAACRECGVPVVQTLHNFRLICPNGLLMRNGGPCEDCVGTSLFPALRYRCYRESFAATAAQVWMLQSNRWRGTYQDLVDRYIAPSRFAAGRLIAGGLPSDRMAIKGHFLPDPPMPGSGKGGYALFVGRLSEEKGVDTLIEAWGQSPGIPLRIVGDGDLRATLEAQAKGTGRDIAFLGIRPHQEVLGLMGEALAVIMPSRCYETFGMAIMESFAMGTPVLASRIGSLEELVEDRVNGMKFQPGDPSDLAAKFGELVRDQDELQGYRARARATFDKRFRAEANLNGLMDIYRGTLAGYGK